MIEVKNLCFSYPGNNEDTIKELDFKINRGEIFGFLGPSGAGKSTTQKILIGILRNYRGNVRVGGKEVNNTGTDFYEKIGVAFEFPNFYSKLTALENLNYFASFYSEMITEPKQLLSLVGLEQDIDNLCHGFSPTMERRRLFVGTPLFLPICH